MYADVAVALCPQRHVHQHCCMQPRSLCTWSSAASILEQMFWCACIHVCAKLRRHVVVCMHLRLHMLCVRSQHECELCPPLVSAGSLQYLCLGPSSGFGHCSHKVGRVVRSAFRFRSVCAAVRGLGVRQSRCHHVLVCWHPGLAHGQRCKAKFHSTTAAWRW